MNIIRDEFLAVGTKELLLIRNCNVHCGCAIVGNARNEKALCSCVQRGVLIGCDLNWHVADVRACWERSKQVATVSKVAISIKVGKNREEARKGPVCRVTSDGVALYNVARVVTLQSLTTYILNVVHTGGHGSGRSKEKGEKNKKMTEQTHRYNYSLNVCDRDVGQWKHRTSKSKCKKQPNGRQFITYKTSTTLTDTVVRN